MLVLGIETSCDETATAIYDSDQGLIANQVYSQIDIHRQYGGVVPELAARDHIRKILPLIQAAVQEAQLSLTAIDGIAYTQGPGLLSALMVGATVGRSLGFALGKPCIGVHHMEAHLMAVMLEKDPPSYPFLALIVSGGHTLLVQVEAFGIYQLLGETLDDAVGEAFDKTAKLLGLDYPGGPALAKLAEQGRPGRFHFPRPMIHREDFNFSFSGLKTFAVNCFSKQGDDPQTKADIAYAFEEAVVETLLIKSRRALEKTHLNRIVMAGGVAANQKLRNALKALPAKVYYPQVQFCTDNAAMVAYTGYCRLARGERENLGIHARARWPIEML